jgi:SAM-dependent methyltransferase
MGQEIAEEEWVRETRFGRWFLGTEIWRRYVLGDAVDIFARILGDNLTKGLHVLDVGCGEGTAFPLLDALFEPRSLIGVDIDLELIVKARAAIAGMGCRSEVRHGSVLDLPLLDDSVDLVFCHQLLHHLSSQTAALCECRRVLAPGGIMLVAESCRSFIEASLLRLLFRHPQKAQKTADQYLQLVRSAGFVVDDSDVVATSPWWSRGDLGMSERWGWARGQTREPTEILLAARKP